ncbi:Gfo/Idh/MocA family protein [Paenibacillus sp. A14]|uniref:Gfo/Idh/MocA family protein n=1 Tax=Paenibacillus sp. A14 TaxID=3119820 RepID=UPI003FA68B6F
MVEKAGGTIKWGIMGTGWIAERFAEDLAYVGNGEGLAAGSRTIESAKKFADRFGLPRAYGTYAELVEDPDIDAIYVATPHPYHRENVLAALNAGKAVLCEKPFTVNSAELEPLVDAARRKKLFLMEAMWTRFLPPIVQVRTWLEEGRIGEVKLLKAEFGFRSDWNPEGRLLNPQLGGGALLDAGIYPVSFASMIFGTKPEHIWSNVYLGQTGVDEHFSILLDYGQGKTASLHGAVRLALMNDAYIHGTEGSIYIPSFLNAKEAYLRVAGQEEIKFSDDRLSTGYAFEAEEVGRCLQADLKESPSITLEESLGIMKLLDEVRGQWNLKYPFE